MLVAELRRAVVHVAPRHLGLVEAAAELEEVEAVMEVDGAVLDGEDEDEESTPPTRSGMDRAGVDASTTCQGLTYMP